MAERRYLAHVVYLGARSLLLLLLLALLALLALLLLLLLLLPLVLPLVLLLLFLFAPAPAAAESVLLLPQVRVDTPGCVGTNSCHGNHLQTKCCKACNDLKGDSRDVAGPRESPAHVFLLRMA